MTAKVGNHPFEAVVRNKGIISTVSFDLVREIGRELSLWSATKNKGGNIAWRENDRYFITTTGADLGKIEPENIVLIHSCNNRRQVEYSGPHPPSSETITWHTIMTAYPEVKAVIHGHDDDGDLIINRAQELGLPIVEGNYPYGTQEFAEAILKVLDDRLFVIINAEGHRGFVSFGTNLSTARKNYQKYLAKI